MTLTFDRPVGAAGDAKELEYVSALHQTAVPDIRKDGSIKDVDVSVFLASRYRIFITPEEVRASVIQGLGGGDDEEDCIDLMEMMAVLLIPALLKSVNQIKRSKSDGSDSVDVELTNPDNIKTEPIETVKKEKNDENSSEKETEFMEGMEPPKGLIQYVLNMILHDVTGTTEPQELNKKLLSDIFTSYGEVDLAQDDELLEEMIEIASGDESIGDMEQQLTLDNETFARVLTGDVQQYDISNEYSVQTIYKDVFGDGGADEALSRVRDTQKRGRRSSVGTLHLVKERAMKKWNWLTSSIDVVANTYRSPSLLMFLWCTFVLFYYIWFRTGKTNVVPNFCSNLDVRNHFGCEIVMKIVVWVTNVSLSALTGVFFVSLPNIGNFVECNSIIYPLIGFLFTSLTLFLILYVRVIVPEVTGGFIYIDIVTAFFGICALYCHLQHILKYVVPENVRKNNPTFEALITPGSLKNDSNIKMASSYKINKMIKNALDLSRNHNTPDNVMDTYYGNALLAFSKLGEKTETTGGFFWVLRNIRNRSLFRNESITLSVKTLSDNLTLFVISIFLLWTSVLFTKNTYDQMQKEEMKSALEMKVDSFLDVLEQFFLKEMFGTDNSIIAPSALVSILSIFIMEQVKSSNIDCSQFSSFSDSANIFEDVSNFSSISPNLSDVAKTDQMNFCDGDLNCSLFDPEFLCTLTNLTSFSENFSDPDALQSQQLSMLESLGFDSDSLRLQMQTIVRNAFEIGFDTLYPKQLYMILTPLIVFTLVTFAVSLFLAMIYIPSVICTTLKLRSGVIPTFLDPNFKDYRVSVDTVSLLSGAVFWGCIYSSLLLGVLCAVGVFFLVWDVTRGIVLNITSMVIGITVTITLKSVVLLLFRKSSYKGFYRTSPGRASFFGLFLESLDFALSVYFTFVRMVKLILVSALYVGRVDTPLLAPGVGEVGPVKFDALPQIFRKSVLANEAHRHPFISLLGGIYLLKLRYGTKFATKAGSCWRLIFVYALFPWMNKYRILTRPEIQKKIVSPDLDEDFETLKHDRSFGNSENDDIIVKLEEENAALREKIAQLTKKRAMDKWRMVGVK